MRSEVFSFFFIFFKKIFTDPNCPFSHQPCWISVGVTEADLSSVVSVDNLPKKSEAQPRRKLCEKDPPEDPWGEQFFFSNSQDTVVKGTKERKYVFLKVQVSSI